MITNIIGWCLFGFVAGLIARFLTPGDDTMGCTATIGLGIAGSFTGGYLSKMLFGAGDEGFQPASYVGAIFGAILLLLLLRFIKGKRE